MFSDLGFFFVLVFEVTSFLAKAGLLYVMFIGLS